MKPTIFLAAIVPALCGHALDPRATACKSPGNNCQRGVAGTGGKVPLSSRLADCASFMATTVIPEPVTVVESVTTTITQTTTSHTGSPTFTKRQATVTPSGKPAYATWCDSDAAYSSACACASVAPSTITAVPATTTSTTVVATTTTCVVEYAFRKRGWTGMADFVDYAFH